MALRACPECNKQVSDQAPTCPGCGAPLKAPAPARATTTRAGGKWEAIGFLLILAGLAAFLPGPNLVRIALPVGFVVFLIGRFK